MVPEPSNVAEELNITEGPFAFDPALPDVGCSSSTSWQDGHLAEETYQPPEKREKFVHRNTYTHSQTDTLISKVYHSVTTKFLLKYS